MKSIVVITKKEEIINSYLTQGYVVKFVVPQSIANSGSKYDPTEGKFCFVLELSESK
jgi:hypothetical protein